MWRFTHRDPTLRQPIFFIGCPRSGTSLAVNLFSHHPHLANWSEAGQIWDPDSYYDPTADHCWDASHVSSEDVERLHGRFEHYRQRSGGRRFVNKHPRNSVRIRYINHVFPDATFIHVIRDGRAVVNSVLNKIREDPMRQTMPYGSFCKPPNWKEFLREDPVEQAALQWREIVRFILSHKSTLGNRYCEFRYEDLCRDPRGTIASLLAFTQLPVTPDALINIPQTLTSMNFKYPRQLSLAEIETINNIQADLLRELGYSV